MGSQRLVQQGFVGYTGWGDVEAEADFRATGGRGKETKKPSPAQAPAPVGPTTTGIQPFQQEQRVRQEEFLGRARGIPETLRALEQELGIPGARETYAEAGGAAREVAGQIRGIPGVQRGATRGFDVTQNQLARMIAQKTQELQPSAEIATRGLEEAGAGLQGLLGAFQTRASNVLAPFEIEAGVLGAQAKNEFDLLKTQMSSALDRELETMRQTGATDRANIQRAIELARIEANEGELVNLGDRVAWMIDGKEISSTLVGLAPKRTTAPTGDVWE